jgi:hypothetical protein
MGRSKIYFSAKEVQKIAGAAPRLSRPHVKKGYVNLELQHVRAEARRSNGQEVWM